MIMKEDIKKELSNFKKLSTLEPLFDSIIAVDDAGFTKVYSYEQLLEEYNHLIDGIEYFLWKIYDLDHEAEAYRSAFCQFSDEYYGLF